MRKVYKLLLRISLSFSNFLYRLITYLAVKSEGGIHPKHRLIGYHDFFLRNISDRDSVLDIGCNNGALTYDIAEKAGRVVGIEIDERHVRSAQEKRSRANIEYIVGDATKDLSGERFDVIILSNVLEHIEHRVDFLKRIRPLASTFLIRVPMLDRDWVPLYKKELGIEYRLDLTHYTEYTRVAFEEEMKEAGYFIKSLSIQFGEIWAVVK